MAMPPAKGKDTVTGMSPPVAVRFGQTGSNFDLNKCPDASFDDSDDDSPLRAVKTR